MSRWWREVSMQLANLLRETLDVDCDEIWENERTHDIRQGVRGASPFDGIVSSGGRLSARLTRYLSLSQRSLELDAQPLRGTERPANGCSAAGRGRRERDRSGRRNEVVVRRDRHRIEAIAETDVYSRRGTDPARRFCTALPRNTISTRQIFSSMLAAI